MKIRAYMAENVHQIYHQEDIVVHVQVEQQETIVNTVNLK